MNTLNLDKIIYEIIHNEINGIISETKEFTPYRVQLKDGSWMWIRSEKEKKAYELEKLKAKGINPVPNKPIKRKRQQNGLSSVSKPIEIAKQIGEMIKNEYFKKLRNFIKNSEGVYGRNVANAFVELYRKEQISGGKNLFNEFALRCREIEEKVANVQQWGRNGEKAIYSQLEIISRDLKEAIQIIFDLKNITQDLKQKGEFNKFLTQGKGNIIIGYNCMPGLNDQIISKNTQFINKETKWLLEFANLLDEIVENRDSRYY
jgi:hypothetical protein